MGLFFDTLAKKGQGRDPSGNIRGGFVICEQKGKRAALLKLEPHLLGVLGLGDTGNVVELR